MDIMDEASYFDETGKLFPLGVTTEEYNKILEEVKSIDPHEILKTWTVAELDILHDSICMGTEWRASERREELMQIEEEEQTELYKVIDPPEFYEQEE